MRSACVTQCIQGQCRIHSKHLSQKENRKREEVAWGCGVTSPRLQALPVQDSFFSSCLLPFDHNPVTTSQAEGCLETYKSIFAHITRDEYPQTSETWVSLWAFTSAPLPVRVCILTVPGLQEQPVAWSTPQSSTVPFLHCEDKVTCVECFRQSLVLARGECLMTVSCHYYFTYRKEGSRDINSKAPTIIHLSVYNQPLEGGQPHGTIYNQQINTVIDSTQESPLFAPGQ